MELNVKTSTGEYPIIIGRGIINDLPVPFDLTDKKILIVTDDSVGPLYADKILKKFPSANVYTIPHGENSKSFFQAEQIVTKLASLNFTRQDHIFALGGGVVGDLAGFGASIYMRGIPYLQIPTSLLAGIDSSVGGKTAVNIPYGKNLVGRIYPPKAVIFDVDTLSTLPEKYVRDGVGEGLKYAILDSETFDVMESGYEKNLDRFVYLCVKYKKDVVEKDENEKSLRRLLNLGHTLGHSIERKSDLTITHGVCVAMGLRLITTACRKNGMLPESDYSRITALLDRYDVPTCPYKISELVDAVAVDKKTLNGVVNLVTVHGIGDCRITPVPLGKLEEFFS